MRFAQTKAFGANIMNITLGTEFERRISEKIDSHFKTLVIHPELGKSRDDNASFVKEVLSKLQMDVMGEGGELK